MPAFAGFHDHGPFSSLRKNDWMFAKAIVGWARYNGRTKISISKQESKKNFAVYRIYITSTNVVDRRFPRVKMGHIRQTFALTASFAGGAELQACRGSNRDGG